jgi:hypothetical protein
MPFTLGVEASAISALIAGGPYLDPAVGYAATPDAAAFTIFGDFCLTARAVLPAAVGANRMLACQWPTGPSSDQAFLWFITTAGIMQITLRAPNITQSTANVLTAAEVNAFGGSPVYIGVRCRASTGRFAAITSTDGIIWNEVGTPVTTTSFPSGVINSTTPLHIGSRSVSGADRWNQPIFWAEMRMSLNPGTGTRAFRFDASEALGTSWTDPRGIPWSLSAAGAIHS